MLPTAGTALSAAQLAHVFEKYAFQDHDLNSLGERGPPNHLPQTPSPRGGAAQREPCPLGLTGKMFGRHEPGQRLILPQVKFILLRARLCRSFADTSSNPRDA